MAKLYALTKIIMPDDTVVPAKTVFDATPAQAIQFDKLKSARPATAEEIRNAALLAAVANGTEFNEPELPLEAKAPASGAAGDPNGVPKGKSA
jgi:hypothetical protein